jgi:hypothetical protein
MRKLIMTLVVFGKITSAHAVVGNEGGGGGETVGLEFQAAAYRALQNADSTLLDKATYQRAIETIRNARFLVTKEKLTVLDQNGREMNPVAVNYPNLQSIYIDAEKWNGIAHEDVRQSLSFHEVLSLMKIEKTGDYHLSSRLKNIQISSANLIKANAVVAMDTRQLEQYQTRLFAKMSDETKETSPYETLKELYETANAPASEDAFINAEKFKKDPSQAYRTLGENVERETERDELFSSDRKPYLFKDEITYVISGGRAPKAPVAGKGPLFPGKPGEPGRSSICGSYPVLYMGGNAEFWFNDLYAEKCDSVIDTTSSKRTHYVDIKKTKTDLIVTYISGAGLSLADLTERQPTMTNKVTTYYRKTGKLVAIKIVQEYLQYSGQRSTSVSYNYGWK